MKRAAALFALAAAFRLAYLFAVRPPIESYYWGLSEGVARGGSFAIDGVPNTGFEPLYPLFLAAARLLTADSAAAVQVLQVLMASSGAVLLYVLAAMLSASRRVALAAGVLFAGYPLLVRHAAAATDSALTTVLLLAFAIAFVTLQHGGGPGASARAGAWLGAAVLCRAMVLPLVPVAAILVAIRRGVRDALLFTGAALLVTAPWMARNYSVGGSPWPTRGGLNLYIGNSPYTGALFPSYDLDLLEPHANEVAQAALAGGPTDNAREADAVLTRAAVGCITERPLKTLTGKLRAAAYFLSPFPIPTYTSGPETRVTLIPPAGAVVDGAVARPRIETLLHTAAAGFVLIAAIVGVYLRRERIWDDAILWAIVLVFVAVYAVYVPATRYRAPMEFVLMFYAAVGVRACVSRR